MARRKTVRASGNIVLSARHGACPAANCILVATGDGCMRAIVNGIFETTPNRCLLRCTVKDCVAYSSGNCAEVGTDHVGVIWVSRVSSAAATNRRAKRAWDHIVTR